MFKIDFTRPHLYEDVVTLNQGNLSTNNTLRCKVVTGGNDDVTGASIVCTFVINGKQVFESGKVVNGTRGIVDVVFPSEALVVGENTLEFLVNRIDGSVAQSPVIKYRVWQGLTTDEGVRADSNYPLLVELINQANSAVNSANEALEGANSVIAQGDELKASVDKLKADCMASVNSFTEENSAKIDNVITQNVAKIDAAIVKNEASIVKADAAAEKAILAANNSDTKTAENIKNVNAAIAAGTQDLEVKAARVDMDGVEHGSLKERLESDLKKGKQISETKEGAYVSFDNTVDSVIPEIELHGNTVQNSSNLADIKSSGIDNGDGTFKMSILSCGENLNSGMESGGLDTNSNNLGNPVADSNFIRSSKFVKISGSEKITVSTDKALSVANMVMISYDNNLKALGYEVVYSSQKATFTPKQNAKYIKIRLQTNDITTKAMIQEGTVATPYTPYEETRCDIKLPCQLEKIGYLADRLYFDKVENALCVDKKNLDFTINGSEKWMLINTRTDTTCFGIDNPNFLMGGKCISDKFSFYPPVTIVDTDQVGISVSGTFNRLIVRVKTSLAGTVADWINYLKQNNMRIKINASNVEKIVLPQSEQVKLNSFANKTHIYTISGDVDATVKATVSKSLASTVQANTNEINILNDKIENIQGLKESQDFAYETDKGYLVCKDTQNGVVKDLKICGKSLVNRFVYASNGDDTETVKQIICKDYKNLNSGKFTIPNISNKPLRFNIYNKNNDSYIRTQTVSPRASVVVDLDRENAYLYDINGAVSDGWTSCDELKAIAMFIQGEHVNLTLNSHFEGIASVGNGNEIEVLSNGKNFFYGVLELGDWKYDGSNMNNAKGNYTNVCRNSVPVRIIPNTSFCINFSGNLYNIRLVFFDINGKFITTRNPSKNNCSFTSPQNAYYMCFNSQSIDATDTIINSNVMINIGDNFEKFEPFKQDKKTILFKDIDNTWKPVTELRGIDIYKCDTIEQHSDGKHYLHVRTKKEVLRGLPSELWESRTPLTNAVRFGMNLTDAKKEVLSNSIYTLSDTIPSTSFSFFYNIDNVEGLAFANDSTFLNIQILKSKLETSDVIGFKKWLQSNPITVIYQLAQEKVYEVNPLGLQSFENETMILFGSGVIAPYASWKITSSLPNFVQNIEDRVCRLENDAYKVNLANFAVALNMLDMKARLESLEAPIN